MSLCRSCGETVTWIKLKSGKSMPVNDDKITIVTKNGEVVSGSTSHFATCPQAQKWRDRA